MAKLLRNKRTRRRIITSSVVGGNVVILAIVAGVIVSNPSQGSADTPVVASSAASHGLANPLDKVSSASIAENVARMNSLPEMTAVTNQADSETTELAAMPSASGVVDKPQVVMASSSFASNKDIKTYTTVGGDTITSIAAKFGITSDSIRWSNNLNGDAVGVGVNLLIPPVTGIVYTVAAGDTPATLASKFKADQSKITAFNDAEISGLRVGERILIPDGQKAAPVVSASAFSTGSSFSGKATYGYNGYDYGYCTWYVANRRAQIGRPVPMNLGNAYTWDDRARAMGLSVGTTPQVGAAVVTSTSRNPGHVAFVEAVNGDGTIWISEMNSRGQRSMTDSSPAGGWGKVDYKIISGVGLNYIY